MQSQNQIKLTELTSLFNYLFDKQNLRKNIYLFNAMNHNMSLSLKTIQKQRKVSVITNETALIIAALKLCPLVQMVDDHTIKILMKGDDVVVRLRSSEGKNITKKEINHLTTQMRCENKQQKNGWVLQFKSHAAAVEFIERVKVQEKGYITELLSNDPYEFLSKSISNLRKDKKTQRNYMTAEEAFNHSYYNYNYLGYLPQYPPFIRRAVDSDEEETIKPTKKKQQKDKKSYQDKLNKQDFPSFNEVQQALKKMK